MLPGTSKGSKRYTVLHVSFSNRFWVSILDPPHRVYRLRPYFIKFKEGLFLRITFTKQLSGKGRKEERLLLMRGYFKRKQQPK